MPATRDPVFAGVALGAAGAVCYGVTVVMGRDLAADGLDAGTALGVRFALAAAMLLVLALALRLPLRPAPGEWLRVLLLGGIGYTTEATLFYFALERGTAAAAILLFYAYPAMVVAWEIARGRERADRVTLGALLLSSGGTAAVVAARGDVSISTPGVVFALASAAVYGAYLVVGRELGRATHPVTTAAWVAVGASASSLARAVAGGGVAGLGPYGPRLVPYGAATAAAFALTFAALRRLGPARTAVVCTLEAFSTIVLGALFLGERITAVQALGGVAVIGAAVVIALAPAQGTEPAGSGDINPSVDVPPVRTPGAWRRRAHEGRYGWWTGQRARRREPSPGG